MNEYEYARIQYGTEELIEGESSLPPGVIYIQYEETEVTEANE